MKIKDIKMSSRKDREEETFDSTAPFFFFFSDLSEFTYLFITPALPPPPPPG